MAVRTVRGLARRPGKETGPGLVSILGYEDVAHVSFKQNLHFGS